MLTDTRKRTGIGEVDLHGHHRPLPATMAEPILGGECPIHCPGPPTVGLGAACELLQSR